MSKPFKNLDEQLSILKTRNLKFDDENIAKSYLLNLNYYNLINMYGKFFLNSNQSAFVQNANFNEIIAVYHFEREIRNDLLKYILVIESRIKSVISHKFSALYSNKYDYLNISNFNQSDVIALTLIMSSITKTIKRKRESKNNSVIHYEKKHGEIPLWVIVNYLEFGIVEAFYKHMKKSDQNQIAKHFSDEYNESYRSTILITPEILLSYITNIRELRNVLAHNNKLIRFKCKSNCLYVKEIHDEFLIKNNDPKQDFYNTFIISKALLPRNEFAVLHNSLLKKTIKLNEELSSISVDKVLVEYGFPTNWISTKEIS